MHALPEDNVQIPTNTENIIIQNRHHAVPITLTWHTIVKIMIAIVLFMVLRWLVTELSDILILMGIVLFLALALSPILTRLEKYIPRGVAIILVYIIFFGGLGALIVNMIPIILQQLLIFTDQIKTFLAPQNIQNIPLLEQFMSTINISTNDIQTIITENITSITSQLQGIATGAVSFVGGIFNSITYLSLGLVLLFFTLLEREAVGNFFLLLMPEGEREYVKIKTSVIQHKMGEWFEAQAILMLSIGVAMFIGLLIFHYIYGFQHIGTLALFAGFMELFPYIGVLLTGVLCVLVALPLGLPAVIAVIIWIVIVQFLEGNILVPIVMQRVVGLSAIVTILSLIIGASLGTALGGFALSIIFMILSIPIAAIISIFLEEYVSLKDSK